METESRPISNRNLLIAALLLIFLGGLLAYSIQTAGGIEVRDVRFTGSNGQGVSALLYIPPGVSKKNPAPGIVATHGYINSRETQDGFAIEFARRGYVVLAPDQSGHGFSDPPAFANGFGGMDGLPYLRSLDIVDKDNIGLEGHSMGGWASLVAASVYPGQYKSFVLASSSPGTYGTAEGTPTYPRNMALIYSTYDEFSQLMWGIPVPGDIVNTDKLKKLFNTTETVQPNKLYGSIEDGTARKFYQPDTIHPKIHLSFEGIGNAIEWMQTTLKGGNGLPPSDQIWHWKEIGNLIALIGMILLLFPVGSLLLKLDFFSELKESVPECKPITGNGWWIGALITVLLPIPLYMWMWNFHGQGILKASWLFPQTISSVVIFWAMSVALVSLILLWAWHAVINKKTGATFSNYGLTWGERGIQGIKVAKSFLLAAIIAFFAYLSLAFSDWLFTTDYRFWVFAIKPMSALHFGIFLRYLIPFAIYFLIAAMILHGQLRRSSSEEPGMAREMITNILLMILGYVLFLIYHYAPLFAGGSLGVLSRWAPLYGIVMFQFIPIFTIVALVSTYFFRKTGRIYTGAFLNAIVVTWIVVAGQATHYPF